MVTDGAGGGVGCSSGRVLVVCTDCWAVRC